MERKKADVMAFDESRRGFLKAMGLGAGSAALLSACGDTDIINQVSIEVRKELVEPNVDPQDFVQPGIGVYYATTCRMCPAGCGVHGRNREGRVLKLEGNPASPINRGKLCPMGQAGLHAHYNPDRLTKPLARKGGKLVAVSWDEAEDLLKKALGRRNPRLAWLTGVVSGHRRAVIEAHLDAVGSKQHFVFDPMSPEALLAANEDVFGTPMPLYAIDKAALVLSFGADFLGPWMSPVHFSRAYANFRMPPRGALVQIESKMSLTGANADRWIAVRPGTEGHLAMAIASLLALDETYAARIPDSLRKTLASVDVRELANVCDVSVERIHKLRKLLTERTPSLVLAGYALEGYPYGVEAMKAVLLLNVMLGNVGKTVLAPATFPFPDLEVKTGGWKQLSELAKALLSGEVDTLVLTDSNPLYHAPKSMGFDKAFAKAKTKVAFSMFMDETTAACDLVLPIHSYLEEWDTSRAWYPASADVLNIQQPVMTPLFETTRSFGDLMLAILGAMKPEFKRWKSYQAYVMDALWTMRGAMVQVPKPTLPGQTEEEAFRQQVLSQGFVRLKTKSGADMRGRNMVFTLPKLPKINGLRLLPTPRLGLYDGRHANLPWLQELPDQLAAVVWDSWAELHPKTAERLGVKTGDVLEVSGTGGSLKVKVVVTPAIHQEAVGIPLGQGHSEYGRYAKGRGIHPYTILPSAFDAKSGQLSFASLDVTVKKVAAASGIRTLAHGDLVVESNVTTQAGRKIIKTVTAEAFHRYEKKEA